MIYQNKNYFEDNRMSVNERIKTGFGRWSKSPIGDVGSLLWRRRSATLAGKEWNWTRRVANRSRSHNIPAGTRCCFNVEWKLIYAATRKVNFQRWNDIKNIIAVFDVGSTSWVFFYYMYIHRSDIKSHDCFYFYIKSNIQHGFHNIGFELEFSMQR